MKQILIIIFFVTFFIGDISSGKAQRVEEIGESYAQPTMRDIIQTGVMLGGFDISDTRVSDEYAKLAYCPLYKENFSNDFQWQNIRRQIISRIQEKKEYFRVQYEVHSSVKLGRYNFENQFFPFAEEDRLQAVGSIIILDKNEMTPLCQDIVASKVFPARVVLRLGEPLTFDKLKIPMDEAENLFQQFENMRDPQRMLYARLRFKVLNIVPDKNLSGYASQREMVLLGSLKEIALFLDKDMTQLVQVVTAE